MSHVTVTREAARLTLALARPEKKNALTNAMYTALHEALEAAAEDAAVGVVVLTGAPGVFTAGNDLGDFMANPPSGENSPVFRLLRALVNFPKPIVAAVDGPAVGIGTTALLHCDFVVATPTTRFQMPFVKLGLVPEGGSSLLLPQLAGLQRASEHLLLGEPFDATEAKAMGLVNRIVPADELLTTANHFADAFAARPREAIRLAKALLRDRQRAELLETLGKEGAVFVERLSSPEAHAAFAAFFAKK
jgi:enoyl-CoA hydratase/carnithine racemase